MARVILLTGGNLGDVAATLARAKDEIARCVGRIELVSSVHASEPWGFEAPECFLNQVLVVETLLSPEEVLDRCQEIERKFGRRRKQDTTGDRPEREDTDLTGKIQQYASRTLDIDLLFYDDRIIVTGRLIVPHPLIPQRAFVLQPLAEALPAFVHPQSGLTIAELLAERKRLDEKSKNDYLCSNRS